MYTTLWIFVAIFFIGLIVFIFCIKFDSEELEPDSPFYDDEIRAEGIDKVRIKKK